MKRGARQWAVRRQMVLTMARASNAIEDAFRWLLPMGLITALLWFCCTTAFADSSPTGRTPKIFWTPERQAVWNQMRAANHPWWQQVKANADLSGTSTSRYADLGQWATLAYQVTGDPTYAAKAFAEADNNLKGAALPNGDGRNFTREHFIEYAWMYDWLRPALTDTQRQQWMDSLNYWADLCLGQGGVSWGTALGDSDETTGHYFGLVLWGLASEGDNPRAGEFLTHSKVGGLDQTGTSRNNMRNAVSDYIRRAAGGVWLEGTEYNLGTLQLLLMGADGVRTATGSEHFPELPAFLQDIASAQLQELTPDLKKAFQWGDTEEPHGLKRDRRLGLLNLVAGLLQGDSRGPAMRDIANRLQASSEPNFRWMMFADPTASASDFRVGLAPGHVASGMGVLLAHDGWNTPQSLFASHLSPRTTVHHEPHYLSNFELYRQGEFVITHVTGYDANEAEHHNSMLLAGLSMMDEARGPIGGEVGADYAYHVGATGGNRYIKGYYNPPTRFLHEWTRSLLYLPSTNAQHDTVVVFDRVNAQDPETLTKLDRYTASDLSRITKAPALKQWVLHAPVSPTLTAGAISWQTGGGQAVRVATLLPADQTRAVYDESTMGLVGTIVSSEKKFQVRIRPGTDRRWDAFLNVVQAADNLSGLANDLVTSANGAAAGVILHRPGHADVLALFNAAQGPDIPSTKTVNGYLEPDLTLMDRLNTNRLQTSGYTVTWSATTASTTAFLMDLDPGTQWLGAVDGQPEQPLTVSSNGLARVTVSGAGSHTLQVRANGEAVVTDTTPPAFTGVQISGMTATGATLSWTTNEPTTGTAAFGPTTAYGQSAVDAALATSHAVAVSGLQPETLYHYRITATDAAGNQATSLDATFTTAADTSTPPPAGGLMTEVQAISGKPYAVDQLVVGATVFIDRTATFSAVPSAYVGQDYIQPANDDKSLTSANALTFTLTQAADVLVAYDARAITLPLWLAGWQDTGLMMGTGSNTTSRRVFQKAFPAGPVVLGGNAMAPMLGAESTYSVIAIPSGTTPEPEPEPAPEPANQPPVLGTIGSKTVAEGQTLIFSLSVSDPDGDPLTFSVSPLPAGAVFDQGAFAWTPGYDQADSYAVTFSASDGQLSAEETVALTVTPTNRAPILQPVGAQDVAEGGTLALTLSGSDPDGDPVVFAVQGLPAGATLNSGMFSWTPAYDQAGTYAVIFSASDGTLAATETVTVTVHPVNQLPLAEAGIAQTVQAGDLVTLDGTGSIDPDGDPLTYQFMQTAGLSVVLHNPPPEQPTFTAPAVTAPTTLTFTLTVGDGAATAQDTVTVTVQPAPAPAADLITNIKVTTGRKIKEGTLAMGQLLYIDRTYTFSGIPAAYLGAEYLQMANEDKYRSDSSYLTFTLNAAATVYVAFSPQADTLPSWLKSWIKTGEQLQTTDGVRTLYKKAFPAGKVSLGGNGALWKKDAYSQYSVFAVSGE